MIIFLRFAFLCIMRLLEYYQVLVLWEVNVLVHVFPHLGRILSSFLISFGFADAYRRFARFGVLCVVFLRELAE